MSAQQETTSQTSVFSDAYVEEIPSVSVGN